VSRREIPIGGASKSVQMEAQEAAEQANLASAVAAKSAPSAHALGRHLADLEWAYHAQDCADLARSRCSGGANSANETPLMYERIQAVRNLIATIPAANISDAAVLVAEAHIIADQIAAHDLGADEVALRAERVTRMLASALPWIASAARLELNVMYWSDKVELGARRYADVAVQP